MARALSESMMNEIHDRESINIISVAIGRSSIFFFRAAMQAI